MNLIPEHLVEMRDTTGGTVLHCHACAWKRTLTASESPLDLDTYQQVRHEAMLLRDRHQYPALRFGILEYQGADRG